MSDLFNGIEKGSVVRIKFKSIIDILNNQKMKGAIEVLDTYGIGENIKALMLSGDFVVINPNLQSPIPSINIDNHYDGGEFQVYPQMVDSIEVIDVANKFVSEDHGIIMIQVGDKLYINGILLGDENEDIFSSKEDDLETKFITFMEKFVLAKAFERSLNDSKP